MCRFSYKMILERWNRCKKKKQNKTVIIDFVAHYHDDSWIQPHRPSLQMWLYNHFSLHCTIYVLLTFHRVRVPVKHFSGLSNACGLAPNFPMKNFKVMITEVFGTKHCSSHTICSSMRENGMAQQRSGAALHGKSHSSSAWEIRVQKTRWYWASLTQD